MNDSKLGITRENLLRIMPPALAHDPSIMALAAADAEVLAARLAEIDQVRIISNIDGLNETVLDILARDFKVDWWDPEYSIEEKRRTLKDSWRVHKLLGTKAAVETALHAVYPEAAVKEWFEYEGGKPYHFKLYIDLSNVPGDDIRPWQVVEKVNFYKSLRSHLDSIEFTVRPKEPSTLRIGGAMGAIVTLPLPETEDRFRFESALRTGGLLGTQTIRPLPEWRDAFSFQHSIQTGGRLSGRVVFPVPEDSRIAPLGGVTHAGGRGAPITTIPIPEL